VDKRSPESFKREEKVDAYMQRLNRLFLEPDESKRRRNINMVADSLLDSVVISEDNFPDRYLEDEQRLARVVQADQKASFMRWIDYLSSDDAPYPAWFSYYTLRNVSRLQPFDKQRNQYPKRSKSTTKKFPEINREALAFVFDSLSEDTPEDVEVLKKLVDGGNFAKLYAHAVDRQMHEAAEAKEKRDKIDGSWTKYDQGSDHMPLVDSVQGMGTGWCTAGEANAELQLQEGDFYVFYSKDDEGEDAIPRIAIRMAHGEVAEVRGVNPDQELEPELVDTARERFKGLPGGDKYEKRYSNMKKLSEVERKTKDNEELSDEEIRFLYEIEGEIEGFGYERDPRIYEIKEKRNPEHDMPIAFGCEPGQIADEVEDITGDTVAYVGKLAPGLFKKADGLKHVYTDFPRGKVDIVEIKSRDISVAQLIRELSQRGVALDSNYLTDLIGRKEGVYDDEGSGDITFVSISGGDFFPEKNGEYPTIDEVNSKAKYLGLEVCTPEEGLSYLRGNIDNIRDDTQIYLGTEPLSDKHGYPRILYLENLEHNLELNVELAESGMEVANWYQCLFRTSKK